MKMKLIFSALILLVSFSAAINVQAAYDPNRGQWLTRDPIGENGGINLYDYVDNDPILKKDRYGLYGGIFWPGANPNGMSSTDINLSYLQTCPKKDKCAHIQFIQIVSDDKLPFKVDYPMPGNAPPENAYPFYEWGQQSTGNGQGDMGDQPGNALSQDFETCAVCMETGHVLGCHKWGISLGGVGHQYGTENKSYPATPPSSTFTTITGYK